MEIQLPAPLSLSNSMSIEIAIKSRETKRDFTKIPLSLSQLSLLLWSAQGKNTKIAKLNAPSAGGQYPLEIFVIASRIMGIESGIYKYDNSRHSLNYKKNGDFKEAFYNCTIGEQPWVRESS